MTPEELVDQRSSPGPSHVFGVDPGSNKQWRADADVVQTVAPRKKEFLTPVSTWTWNHACGFEPLVEAYDALGVKLICYIQHNDVNNLTVTHLYNLAGFLILR